MTSALHLNAGEVEQLTKVFQTTDDRRLRDRAQAVLMVSHGRSPAQIAEILARHHDQNAGDDQEMDVLAQAQAANVQTTFLPD